VPLQGTQAEFDAQVLALATILCDSINAQALLGEIGDTPENRSLGSIARLEKWLEQQPIEDYQAQTEFLRALQSLRSAGSAHRKGSKYAPIRRLSLMSTGDASD